MMQKSLIAFSMTLVIAGCEQSGISNHDDNGGDNSQIQPLGVSGVIAKMEGEGSAPVLDRSDTLKGEDENDNGIRDDIESYIETTSLPDEQKEGLSKYARGMQKIQTAEEMTPEVASSITDSYISDYFCMTAFSQNQEEIRGIANEVSAFTANTSKRTQRYLEYNEAMDGSTINMPSPSQCQELSQ